MPLTELNRPTLSIVYQAVELPQAPLDQSPDPFEEADRPNRQRDPSIWLYQPRAGR